MELRVAAGQDDEVAGRHALVGQGREEGDLRAACAPVVEEVWVGEGEGRVARHRDGLGGGVRAGAPNGRKVAPREREEGREVHALLHGLRGAVEEGVEVRPLGGLDETEVPRRMLEAWAAGQGAQHGQAHLLHRARAEPRVARRADLVEDDARDPHARVRVGKARGERPGRLRHPARIDDQDHGQAQHARDLGRSAAPVGRRAVEEAHGPFHDERAGPPRERPEPRLAHGEGIEVDARTARGSL
jgi:hypothetical protein